MSRTKSDAAGLFYADWLLPLRHANLRRQVQYFARNFQSGRESYWERPTSRTGGIEALSPSTQSATALLERLGDYWCSRDEGMLTLLLPELAALRANILRSGAATDEAVARVPDFIYPMS